MATPRRLQRLERLLLQTLGPAVQKLADPRLGMVTVTNVRLSPDLSIARVNWSCLGEDGDISRARHGLEHARGVLQGIVGDAMRTRTTPRLEFHFDEGLRTSVRVNAILDELARERAEREGPVDGEAAEDEDETDGAAPEE